MKSELNLGVLFTGKLDATFDSVINRIQNSIGKLEGATAKVTAAQKQQQQGTLSLQMGLKSYIQDVEKLLQIQVRWYGAKMLLFAAVELPLAAIKNIVQYGGEVDKARSEMLRWAATSGTVSQQVIKDTDEIIKAIRKATTEYPVDFADMSKSAQAFLGAGIKYGTVKDMIPDLAKLRTAFKEIGIDDFAVAMTGFFKTFKDSIIEGATEAEKFKKILNSLLAAQAEGIIRPEQFTKVIQYLGNITYLSGFSVDQMLALSVAITDSGIRASSAARTFSGLLTTLQGTNAAKVLFEKFGITIDRNRVFAEQFFEIIKKMREKIGEGPITVGWLQAIFKITSVEQGRALAALINQFATVEPLLTKLKNASKGLDLAADIMKNNLPDQLKMIVNMIKEMGFSIGANAIPSLKAFVGSLWEVGRGVLAAIDPTGVFTDKIEGFSSASMRAYEATHNLLGALSSVGSVLIGIVGPLWEVVRGWGQLIELLIGFKTALAVIVDVYLAKLVLYLGMQAGVGLTTLLFGLRTALKMTTLELVIFGDTLKTLVLKNAPLIILTAAIYGLNFIFDKLNANMDKLDKKDLNFDNLVKGATLKTIDPQIQARKTELDLFGRGLLPADTKRIDQLKYEIATLELKKKSLEKAVPVEKKKKEPTLAPPETTKNYGESLIASIKAQYNAEIEIRKANDELLLKLMDNSHKLGLMSDKQYYEDKEKLLNDSLLKELNILIDEKIALDKQYAKNMANLSPLDVGKKAKMTESQEADLARITAKYQLLTAKRTLEIDDSTTQNILNNLEKKKAKIENEFSIGEVLREKALNQELFNNSQRTILNDWLYSQKLRGAKEYYAEEEKLAKEKYDRLVSNLRKEQDAYKLKNEQSIKNEPIEKNKDALRADAKIKEQQYYSDLQKLDNDYSAIVVANRQKEYEDFEKLYSDPTQGIVGVVQRSLGNITRELDQYGQRWKSFTETIAQGMSDAFETFFTDSMKLQLQSLGDYFNLFVGGIQKAMAHMLAEETTKAFLKIISQVVGTYFGGSPSTADMTASGTMSPVYHAGGIVGQSYAPTRSVSSMLFANAPKLHSGLKADEFPAILQSGETVIPRGQGSTPNIEVNIQNETGTSMGKNDVKIDFDPEKMVVGIILKNVAQNGALRGLMGRA